MKVSSIILNWKRKEWKWKSEDKENHEFQLQMIGLLCNQQGVVRQSSDSSGEHASTSFNYHPMYSFTPSEDYGDTGDYKITLCIGTLV